MADTIDLHTAQSIALEFANSRIHSRSQTETNDIKLAYTAHYNGADRLFVFNLQYGGFIIVSGDDSTRRDVLGYSLTGSFDYSALPDNARNWIDSYTKAIYDNEIHPEYRSQKESSKALSRSESAIAPLLGDNHWSQYSPYNDLCPKISEVTTPSGCVATSMAQVMWYHKWPKKGYGLIAYEWGNTILRVDLNQSTYNWDLIKAEYDTQEDNNSTQAVSMLLRDVGYSVHMVYGINGSGSSPSMASDALKKNFSYRSLYLNSRCETKAWDAILYDELSEGRPVIYDGSKEGLGGHSFVCDGYDKNGYFHFNWGWGGDYDGYFLSSANLFPDGQSIIFGIEPKPKSEGRMLFYNRSGLTPAFSGCIPVYADIISSKDDNSYEAAFAIENISTGETVYQSFRSNTVGIISSDFFPDGSDLPDGDYKLYPVARAAGDTVWRNFLFPEGAEQVVTLPVREHKFVFPEKRKWNLNGFTVEEVDDRIVDVTGIEPDPNGTIIIPSQITIDGKQYGIRYMPNIEHLPSLKKIINNSDFYLDISHCENLESITFTGNNVRGRVEDCQSLKDIILPENISDFGLTVYSCENLKVINFPEFTRNLKINQSCLNENIEYYLHSLIPPTIFTESDENNNPNIIFHIPEGFKDVYENSPFSNFILNDDISRSKSVSVEWGYNPGFDVSGMGIGRNSSGFHDVGLKMDESILAPYIGAKISAINFYINNTGKSRPKYIFVANNSSGFICKQTANFNGEGWVTVRFSEPYTITGETIFVGVGFINGFDVRFSTMEYEIPNNAFTRGAYGDPWVPLRITCGPYPYPIALSVMLEGESLPTDVSIHRIQLEGINTTNPAHTDTSSRGMDNEITIDGDKCLIKMSVQNRTLEKLNTITVSTSIDGATPQFVDVPCAIAPNQASEISYTIPFEDFPKEGKVTVNIEKVNGKPDVIADNKDCYVHNANKFIRYPKTLVVESLHFTNMGLSAKAVIGMKQLRENYPNSFIGIMVVCSQDIPAPGDYIYRLAQYGKITSCNCAFFTSRKPIYTISNSKPDLDNFEKILAAENSAHGIVEQTKATLLSNNKCSITSTIRIGHDVSGMDYKLAYAVIENKVGPYLQKNGFANGTEEMDGWEKLGEYVETTYDGLARGIYDSFDGIPILPEIVKCDVPYQVEHTLDLPNTINNIDNVEIVVMLIGKNGEIINAEKVALKKYSGIEQVNNDDVIISVIDNNIIVSENCEKLDIYTIDGKHIARSTDLHTGFYVVRAQCSGKTYVKKVIVK